MKKKSLGSLGENLAANHLHKKGYTILERNFRSKFGEIDLVVLDSPTSSKQNPQTLVFVEVKTRWSQKFGSPEEAITPGKIKRIIKAGQYYKILHPGLPKALRLDAVVIDLSPQGELERVEHIKNLTD
jgi:putative endonuclease